jgi:hypothetical protein
MKYFTAEIEERHGEMEFRDKFLLVAKTQDNADEQLEAHAANWRGEDNTPHEDLNDLGWYDNFEYWTRSLGTEEVSEEVFAVLKEHMPTL